ncbi:hypothetical protein HZC21_01580 [Candidatus Peregrinibacteria bacterium]|nr:hypothetical protein [Candidatus Peregrinibacteria bacterium]
MPDEQEQIGRKATRICAPAFFPDGYCDLEDMDTFVAFRAELTAALRGLGCKERAYGKDATAYYEDECPLRTEPVMLANWVGTLDGKAPIPQRSHYGFDTVGFRVIIRGDGKIQNLARDILADFEPDSGTSEDYEVYSIGCKHVGVEMFDTPLTDKQLETARDLHKIVSGGQPN